MQTQDGIKYNFVPFGYSVLASSKFIRPFLTKEAKSKKKKGVELITYPDAAGRDIELDGADHGEVGFLSALLTTDM